MAELSRAERTFLDWLSCLRAREGTAATPVSRTAMVGATGLTIDMLQPMLDHMLELGYVDRQEGAIYSAAADRHVDGYVITDKGLEALP